MLQIARTGTLAASVAEDNTLRIWMTGSGEPLPYVVEIPGSPVSEITFSPGAEYIALLSGVQVTVIDTSDGGVVAEYASVTALNGLTFAAQDQLYFGDSGGALRLLSRGADNNWNMQQVWQGQESIRLLHASPRGDNLILIDQNNVASQFLLAEGRIGSGTLQLPSDVQEVAFGSNGTRAYFRTARWLHRASSSFSGLTWIDARLIPRSLRGASLVSGEGTSDSRSRHNQFLPVAKSGFIELIEVNFKGTPEAGLFGNKDELLLEWRGRITAVPREESGPVIPGDPQ